MDVIKTEPHNAPLADAVWRAVGTSVRGVSHERNGLPNQDAIGFEPAVDRSGAYGILVVSDGHGDPTCFRSATGSAFAVACARDVLSRFRLARERDPRLTAERVTSDIVAAWNARVDADLAARPFAAAEFARAEGLYGREAHADVGANPRLAYGATLLAALVTNDYCLYAQIGDGDLLALDSDGMTRRIFAPDPGMSGSKTYSLCLPDATRRFHVRLEPTAGEPPVLVLASTDGYANSFAHDADYVKIARDYQTLIDEHGIGVVHDRLESLLRTASSAGSQDDITLGIISRVGARVLPAPRAAAPSVTAHVAPVSVSRSSPWQFLIVILVVVAAGFGGSFVDRRMHPSGGAAPIANPFGGAHAPMLPKTATRTDAFRLARAARWTESALAYDRAADKTPGEASLDAEAALVVSLVDAMERAQALGNTRAAACPTANLAGALAANLQADDNRPLLRLAGVHRLVTLCSATVARRAATPAAAAPVSSRGSVAQKRPQFDTAPHVLPSATK